MAAPYPVPADKPVDTAQYTSFIGKVALITGSSSGIGAATAVAYVRNGAKVALHGRNLERLQQVRDFCLKEGGTAEQVYCVSGDLNDEKAAEKIVNDTVEHYGKLDILVNNAGGTRVLPLANTTPADLDDMYKTNTRSVFHLSQLALPHLKKTKGNILVVSSGGGDIGGTTVNTAYCMAKTMVNMFAKSLALDLAREGVRVNIISPGGVRTAVFRQSIDQNLNEEQKKKAEEKLWDSLEDSHPIGRVGWPEEIAQAILFLTSDVASFVTGSKFHIDGGILAGLHSSSVNVQNAPMAQQNQ